MSSQGSKPWGALRQEPESRGSLEELIRSPDTEILRSIAGNAKLSEDLALALLQRRDLHPSVLEDLAKNGALMKHRKVMVALVSHPRAPRHVSLPIARHLYTFELMQIALAPALAADLKMAVEEVLVSRLESISEGERLNLARRASNRVAAALLTDPVARVIQAALANPYMTEVAIVRKLMRDDPTPALVEAVCRHAKWSLRRDIRIALLRNEHTPLARILEYAESLSTVVLRDVLHHAPLAANVKMYLLMELERREKKETPPKG